MKKILIIAFCGLLSITSYAQKIVPATIIIQVSDPQMGFYSDNRDMVYEIEALTKTVAAINRLQPDIVIFTGDYVHNSANENQWAEFLRIVSTINPSIKKMFLPGNHDVRLKEGSVDVEPYSKHLGADRFNIRMNGVMLTGVNSVYMKDETQDPSKEEDQFDWLAHSLKRKKRDRVSIVFAHHPFFLAQIDEPDGYSTISPEKRRKYFSLFKEKGVQTVFTGHLHDNAVTSHDDIGMITTSAVGRQLGSASSGVRVIIVEDSTINHRYYPLDKLPKDRATLVEDIK